MNESFSTARLSLQFKSYILNNCCFYWTIQLSCLQDVKGPQTVAFNLPNDERIVNEHGTAMVMLKNVSEAKYFSLQQVPFIFFSI